METWIMPHDGREKFISFIRKKKETKAKRKRKTVLFEDNRYRIAVVSKRGKFIDWDSGYKEISEMDSYAKNLLSVKADEIQSEKFETKICYKEFETEFEIQAYIHQTLKDNGINVRGEVIGQIDGDRVIFDLVIFDKQNDPIEIIEVKQNKGVPQTYKSARAKRSQDQIELYKQFDLPVVLISGIGEAKNYIRRKLYSTERSN